MIIIRCRVSGTNITITGSGFDTSPENNIVKIGDVDCYTFEAKADGTEIQCTAGEGPRKIGYVTVRVIGKGFAPGKKLFIFLGRVTSFSPTIVSLGGGIFLDVNGEGFHEDVAVFVNDVPCEVIERTIRLARCILPALPAGVYNVKVDIGDGTQFVQLTNIQYDASTTPTITNISPTTEGAVGGSQLTITGSGFSDNGTLRIGDKELPDAVFTNTTITATLPSMSQGVKKSGCLLVPVMEQLSTGIHI
ncbi:unnamed protein product [Mytilus edulis]|uniref:IPT/TIG domain-containing protein n=1 Tax=Mytilus edulis TaxID=6550 RepID=A0A8S3RXH7_MYTED|nr:unnamed protein product [Mytilus edulis]